MYGTSLNYYPNNERLRNMPPRSVVETTPPAIEPVTLAEAKLWLRVSHSEEDDEISSLITTARRSCETFTGLSFITTTWTAKYDSFPVWELLIRRSPLIAIGSITYTDTSGTSTLLASTNYTVDTSGRPGAVVPVYGSIWPSTRSDINVVTIVYTAGFGTLASSVPEGLKTAIKVMVAYFYEQREPVIVGSIATELPNHVENLLWNFRVKEFC